MVLHNFLVCSQNRLNGASLISAPIHPDSNAQFLSMLPEQIGWSSLISALLHHDGGAQFLSWLLEQIIIGPQVVHYSIVTWIMLHYFLVNMISHNFLLGSSILFGVNHVMHNIPSSTTSHIQGQFKIYHKLSIFQKYRTKLLLFKPLNVLSLQLQNYQTLQGLQVQDFQ